MENTETPSKRQNGYTATPFYRSAPLPPISPQYLSGGPRSLLGIGIRAYGLGIALGLCSLLAIQLAHSEHYIWRAPFFVAALALFHYLEFDMTARFNPSDAKVDSFLLSANGSAYNVAHTMAMAEVLLRSYLYSSYKPQWLRMPVEIPAIFPTVSSKLPIYAGFLCIIVGQYVRSAAMAKAGSSFNHLVQSTKRDDHVLVTNGIYAFSRHPSYFGFFWWGLGTQLVLGNPVCFIGYAVVLWAFFAKRIQNEERFLVQFFGGDYVMYRKRTRVWIPFIR
jgi:protein-S-isoprenylcysteine O-methyltransferase